ncbi:flagellar hook-length control protein FliK [Solimonas sp. SE-A11]|uniref:flagellar hook-length control protein FliK n=1 Tax=Solimonas sp. SE-A11 TaxID=3054954 RepID=UPI00259CA93C|nr:flagellar hook-length control protein FliK [Solimonas sp. SE-A11]MDM4770806.1 flagellar hook-length control protein FliK [Solimonas sp. SE-A11]
MPAVTAASAPPAANAAATATAADATLLPMFNLPLPDAVDAAPPATDAAEPLPEGQSDAPAATAGLVDWLLAMVPPPAVPAQPAPGAADTVIDLPAVAVAAEPDTAPIAATAEIPEALLQAQPDAPLPAPSFSLMVPLPAQFAASAIVAPAAPLSSTPALPPLSLDDPDWSASLGERVSWATESGLSEATIDLQPDELGPIRIRIETQGSLADVSFQAANAATRELLAQSLPQLRGLLNGQGMDMGRSQVAAMPGSRRGEARGLADEAAPIAGRRLYRVGLVDDYA